MDGPTYNEVIEVVRVREREYVAFRVQRDDLQRHFDLVMDMVETKVEEPAFTDDGDHVLIHDRGVVVPT